jgi:hypothetical protein
MRYRLRTLAILTIVGPPVLAFTWIVMGPDFIVSIAIIWLILVLYVLNCFLAASAIVYLKSSIKSLLAKY